MANVTHSAEKQRQEILQQISAETGPSLTCID